MLPHFVGAFIRVDGKTPRIAGNGMFSSFLQGREDIAINCGSGNPTPTIFRERCILMYRGVLRLTPRRDIP